MKKILLLLLVISLCVGLASCVPSAKEEAVQKKLVKKGYDNVIIDTTTVPSLIKSQTGVTPSYLVTASKPSGDSGEIIYAFAFESKDDAKQAYDYVSSWGKRKISGTTVEQSGKWLYFGTEQAVKDFD